MHLLGGEKVDAKESEGREGGCRHANLETNDMLILEKCHIYF